MCESGHGTSYLSGHYIPLNAPNEINEISALGFKPFYAMTLAAS
jgi:hypothetical protein